MLGPVPASDNNDPRGSMLQTHRRIGDILVLSPGPGSPESGDFAFFFEFFKIHEENYFSYFKFQEAFPFKLLVSRYSFNHFLIPLSVQAIPSSRNISLLL